ncbi:hypothetical protein I4U23_010993 [Adineta vaga]|nr:hypothetical protein I4U23_010993 [Adineta vaga]
MAASKKRHLAEKEAEKTMNNFQSDLSSEDELLGGLSSITIDSSDEELPAERHWQSGRFTPVTTEFRGEPGIRTTRIREVITGSGQLRRRVWVWVWAGVGAGLGWINVGWFRSKCRRDA